MGTGALVRGSYKAPMSCWGLREDVRALGEKWCVLKAEPAGQAHGFMDSEEKAKNLGYLLAGGLSLASQSEGWAGPVADLPPLQDMVSPGVMPPSALEEILAE